MKDCIFCKIIQGEIPSDKVYEDETVMAFMDVKPVSRGHLLVIPKKHSTNISETEDHITSDIIIKANKIAKAVVKAVGAHGYTISTNNGEAAGQTVFHLHFHVIPRFTNDGLKPWTHKETEPRTRQELADQIKKHI